jgi:Cu(I)/Ag(I) efflux system membrane protein CusA/SilA
VGFIALIGVSVEIGVIMLLYLNQSWQRAVDGHNGSALMQQQQVEAVLQGAGLRVRPVLMTSLTVAIGLLPILFGSGTGSEVMSRVAAPMVGGMVTAVVLTLLVLPAVFLIWKRSLNHHE